MKQIRKNVFETNSSSCHSLVISKESVKDEDLPKYLNINTNEDFGWMFNCYYTPEEKAGYLCTVMEAFCLDVEKEEFMNKLKNDFHIKVSYRIGSGYVDHDGEIVPFIRELLNDDDKLKRFLFNPKSCIFTGNDNSDDMDAPCFVACDDDGEGQVFDYETNKYHTHPMYDPEHYEYYYKGN